MRKLVIGSSAALLAVGTAFANDLTNPGPVDVSTATSALLGDPAGNLTITGVTMTGGSTATSCPFLALDDVQFGASDGFSAINGIALSNAFLEDLDDDGAATGSPGCAGLDGSIGLAGTNCTGVDTPLSNALTAAFSLAAPMPSDDAAVLTVNFDNTSGATVDFCLNYSFTTFESPADVSFFDSFGIFLDGALVAGGTTNLGSAPGTDPWVLTPGAPGEYQSIPATAFHVVPAHETGIRTLNLSVAPGTHVLEFHVADGGPNGGCVGPGGTPGCCNIVPSVLNVGPGQYHSGNAAGYSGPLPGEVDPPTISRVGHPAPTGAFPADFQVTLSNGGSSNPVFFVQGNSDLALSIPLIAPLELVVGPPALMILAPGSTDALGNAAFPSSPPTISPSITGLTLYFQWFGIDLSGTPAFFNTYGLKVVFGS